MFVGAKDLKNSMGALVAYLGNPNRATFARFTNEYEQAVAEWDAGVRIVWGVAHRSHPPMVYCCPRSPRFGC
jgi:hypothetical protein